MTAKYKKCIIYREIFILIGLRHGCQKPDSLSLFSLFSSSAFSAASAVDKKNIIFN